MGFLNKLMGILKPDTAKDLEDETVSNYRAAKSVFQFKVFLKRMDRD